LVAHEIPAAKGADNDMKLLQYGIEGRRIMESSPYAETRTWSIKQFEQAASG